MKYLIHLYEIQITKKITHQIHLLCQGKYPPPKGLITITTSRTIRQYLRL
jgi:hypothetical protein